PVSSTRVACLSLYFSSHHPAPTEIYTLSLHDALPISGPEVVKTPAPVRFTRFSASSGPAPGRSTPGAGLALDFNRQILPHLDGADRKSTRLNSSHSQISYAVFCLKKKKKKEINCDHTT